jgi:hypothetical protein
LLYDRFAPPEAALGRLEINVRFNLGARKKFVRGSEMFPIMSAWGQTEKGAQPADLYPQLGTWHRNVKSDARAVL